MATTALITGASGGIGMELAKLFARDKIDLVLVARSADKLGSLATALEQEHGIKVHVLAKDLSDENTAETVYDYCRQQQVPVDYLVNNAGFGDFGMFAQCDLNRQLEMIHVNITALTSLTRLFLPAMAAKGYGRILNLASTAAFQPGPGMSVYYASKAYVLHFSEAISSELEGSGVTVTALCPGSTQSGFQQAATLQESRLVKGKKLPSSEAVARYGYTAMMKGRVVAIHGIKNALLVFSLRFSPRWAVRKIVRRMQGKAD